MQTLAKLTASFPRSGAVHWIGLRPARGQAMKKVDQARLELTGLEGDRRAKPGKRAVTLIQAEHLPVIAALAGHYAIEPETLRRNILVSGIPLAALRGRTFRIGTAVLRGTDLCAPCSRMEAALGAGGYNAMRGHGGICAEVLVPGNVAIGDEVTDLATPDQPGISAPS
ncbi:MAG: MOSC domain-containing protein [Pseudomonadota bacterium]